MYKRVGKVCGIGQTLHFDAVQFYHNFIAEINGIIFAKTLELNQKWVEVYINIKQNSFMTRSTEFTT